MRLFEYRRAGAVVVDGDHVLLISMEPPGQRKWFHFPGGGIEEGETAAEAARRELFEETGLRASAAVEYLRAGIHGGQHAYFVMSCDDLRLGEVTGPELEYAADDDFQAVWVPIADLAKLPVFPRCVAERLAEVGPATDEVPWVEDDRSSWDGSPPEGPPPGLRVTARAVVVDDRRIAAIERGREGQVWWTLPGGGIEPGESPEETAVREVREELGLDVEASARLAVVVYVNGEHRSLQTYVWCRSVGGTFGTGDGEEFDAARQLARGTYRPQWLDLDDLPPSLRPAWLADRLPNWLGNPAPARPERFCESHD